MDDQISKQTPKRRWVTVLAGGYLVVLYLALCGTLALIGYVDRQQIPYIIGNPATPTATIVPTPHILVRQPVNSNVVFEDFSFNFRDWSLYFPAGKVEVTNGKLILQSNATGYYAIVENQRIILPSEKYYVQADFTTDIDTNQPYGLVFGLDGSVSIFYLFEIMPRIQMFSLFKYTQGKWDELVPLSRSAIKPYPEVNTLSVYFNQGNIDLYINGSSVASYSDKGPFHSTGLGAFANDAGYRLIVDNFFAYDEK